MRPILLTIFTLLSFQSRALTYSDILGGEVAAIRYHSSAIDAYPEVLQIETKGAEFSFSSPVRGSYLNLDISVRTGRGLITISYILDIYTLSYEFLSYKIERGRVFRYESDSDNSDVAMPPGRHHYLRDYKKNKKRFAEAFGKERNLAKLVGQSCDGKSVEQISKALAEVLGEGKKGKANYRSCMEALAEGRDPSNSSQKLQKQPELVAWYSMLLSSLSNKSKEGEPLIHCKKMSSAVCKAGVVKGLGEYDPDTRKISVDPRCVSAISDEKLAKVIFHETVHKYANTADERFVHDAVKCCEAEQEVGLIGNRTDKRLAKKSWCKKEEIDAGKPCMRFWCKMVRDGAYKRHSAVMRNQTSCHRLSVDESEGRCNDPRLNAIDYKKTIDDVVDALDVESQSGAVFSSELIRRQIMGHLDIAKGGLPEGCYGVMERSRLMKCIRSKHKEQHQKLLSENFGKNGLCVRLLTEEHEKNKAIENCANAGARFRIWANAMQIPGLCSDRYGIFGYNKPKNVDGHSCFRVVGDLSGKIAENTEFVGQRNELYDDIWGIDYLKAEKIEKKTGAKIRLDFKFDPSSFTVNDRIAERNYQQRYVSSIVHALFKKEDDFHELRSEVSALMDGEYASWIQQKYKLKREDAKRFVEREKSILRKDESVDAAVNIGVQKCIGHGDQCVKDFFKSYFWNKSSKGSNCISYFNEEVCDKYGKVYLDFLLRKSQSSEHKKLCGNRRRLDCMGAYRKKANEISSCDAINKQYGAKGNEDLVGCNDQSIDEEARRENRRAAFMAINGGSGYITGHKPDFVEESIFEKAVRKCNVEKFMGFSSDCQVDREPQKIPKRKAFVPPERERKSVDYSKGRKKRYNRSVSSDRDDTRSKVKSDRVSRSRSHKDSFVSGRKSSNMGGSNYLGGASSGAISSVGNSFSSSSANSFVQDAGGPSRGPAVKRQVQVARGKRLPFKRSSIKKLVKKVRNFAESSKSRIATAPLISGGKALTRAAVGGIVATVGNIPAGGALASVGQAFVSDKAFAESEPREVSSGVSKVSAVSAYKPRKRITSTGQKLRAVRNCKNFAKELNHQFEKRGGFFHLYLSKNMKDFHRFRNYDFVVTDYCNGPEVRLRPFEHGTKKSLIEITYFSCRSRSFKARCEAELGRR